MGLAMIVFLKLLGYFDRIILFINAIQIFILFKRSITIWILYKVNLKMNLLIDFSQEEYVRAA